MSDIAELKSTRIRTKALCRCGRPAVATCQYRDADGQPVGEPFSACRRCKDEALDKIPART